MTVSYYSTIIQHDADKVWDTLRDFNGPATWFGSAVSESHITTSADRGQGAGRAGASPCQPPLAGGVPRLSPSLILTGRRPGR